ncbi:hypothetical protein J2X36_004552 [Methylobacterium sp. BE186]|nr:hypothetical protein [Methylobacterium sp. BE186]
MPRRAANVTQADIARAIRAVQNAGLPVLRVVVRTDGVAVETKEISNTDASAEDRSKLADSERVVVL